MPVIVSPSSARTLGDLKTRIADELARSDLTSQIALAITQAIEEACTHRFWFMETVGQLVVLSPNVPTYTGDEFEQLIQIDRVRNFVGTQQRTLRPVNDDELKRARDGTAPVGEPWAYARYGGTLTFYPTPGLTYNCYFDGLTKGATLNSDADSNIWTDETKGERYVRALAKRDIYADVIRDFDKALALDQMAARYRQELEAATHSRVATNQLESFGV